MRSISSIQLFLQIAAPRAYHPTLHFLPPRDDVESGNLSPGRSGRAKVPHETLMPNPKSDQFLCDIGGQSVIARVNTTSRFGPTDHW
jgi:hypothetical protein